MTYWIVKTRGSTYKIRYTKKKVKGHLVLYMEEIGGEKREGIVMCIRLDEGKDLPADMKNLTIGARIFFSGDGKGRTTTPVVSIKKRWFCKLF
jgi:hypothetical protein